MVTQPLLAFGGLFVLVGAYVYRNAESEFDRSMRLKGVDPNAIREGSRRSGIRRNRLVSKIFVAIGVVVLLLGVVV